MRAVVLAAAICISLSGCMSQQERDEQERAALSKRIDEICSLPAGEREAALEKLKKESGLVLVCGK